MKIAKLHAYPLRYPEPDDSNKLSLRHVAPVEADDGAFGWGECISQWLEAALAVKVVIGRGLAPLLQSRDPSTDEAFGS
jgi:L-alanine-DL-glutamate epimerase-like enolase superfamily enzyme